MRREHFRPVLRRGQPVAGDGRASDRDRMKSFRLLPSLKIDGAGKRGHHDKLRKCHTSSLGHRGGRLESIWPICRKAKNKGAQDVNAVFTEGLELRDESLTRSIEVF